MMRGVYDVFICYRGSDTKRNIVSILRGVLESKGIKCFVDYAIESGAELLSGMIQGIWKSRLQIIVLSQGFGRSRLCLDALVEIMNIEAPVRRVLPVFYEVEPCVVRHQKRASPYDLSAVEGSTREDRKRWGKALHQLSHLKGYEYY
ncbi:hypothetical protein KP509_15G015600, partial [Ceratopteris richardii]